MNAPRLQARLARSLRGLRRVRGWQRIADRLAGRSGRFVVRNGPVVFSGDLASYIDRQVYLLGGYEADMIALFLRQVAGRGTVLDVGANAGNHSVFFSRHFARVIAFEPNPDLWQQLTDNAALNPGTIEVHRLGLSDEAGEFQLYNIDNGNNGLATFLPDEQYDKPLEAFATARTVVADDHLPGIIVDAVKIDVQGFEPQVLRGMQALLARSRPVVWVEFGAGTLSAAAHRSEVETLFPYPIALAKFTPVTGALTTSMRLDPYSRDVIELGDYAITPA